MWNRLRRAKEFPAGFHAMEPLGDCVLCVTILDSSLLGKKAAANKTNVAGTVVFIIADFSFLVSKRFAGLTLFCVCVHRPNEQSSILLMITIENRYGCITRYKLFQYCHCFLNMVR